MENTKMTFEDKINLLKTTLTTELSNSDRVFIVPHVRMDFDAIASATALYEICNEFGKETYIVTDDKEDVMETSLKIMFNDLKKTYSFITTSQLGQLRSENELLILTDTNKTNLIPITNPETFKNIIIVDHHKTDDKTVVTDKTLIAPNISSASEIVFNLIKKFNITIDEHLAQRLLAGIYLDTNRLSRNFEKSTSRAVTELLELGADSDEVNNLFLIANFESDRIQQNLINKLIDNTKFSMYNIAITMNDVEPNTLYESDHLAKAADYLLQYPLDAAFVIGFVDKKELGEGHQDIISVKARSKNKKEMTIDVSEVMRIFGGGGDENRAACLIYTDNIEGVKEAINYIMKPGATLVNTTESSNKVLQFMPKKNIK